MMLTTSILKKQQPINSTLFSKLLYSQLSNNQAMVIGGSASVLPKVLIIFIKLVIVLGVDAMQAAQLALAQAY